MFLYLLDGRTRRPTNRWPLGRHGFQGWFHALDAFEAGPVAAYAAARAVYHVVETLVEASVDRGGVHADTVLAAAREAADRAMLAAPGEFGLFLKVRDPAVGDDDERLAALARSNGALIWSKRNAPGTRPLRYANFPSVRHAIAAKDALRADEAVEVVSAGPDWERIFR